MKCMEIPAFVAEVLTQIYNGVGQFNNMQGQRGTQIRAKHPDMVEVQLSIENELGGEDYIEHHQFWVKIHLTEDRK